MEAPGSSVRRLVMIGPPASGKGTQARRLAKELGLSYLSTGALLREHMANGSLIGEVARPILQKGGYLPDSLMCEVVGDWLETAGPDWILDGFPRSRSQSEFLNDWLIAREWELDAAIFLQAPLDVLKRRIQERLECPECRWSGGLQEMVEASCPDCGSKPKPRDDDSLENFLSRHQAYEDSALPLVDDYHRHELLCACDATGPRDEVTAKLLLELTSLH